MLMSKGARSRCEHLDHRERLVSKGSARAGVPEAPGLERAARRGGETAKGARQG